MATIITTTIHTNIISTVTETSTTLHLSITPFANPAATSAVAAQSSLLRSNAKLSKTNITVSLIVGSLSLLLLAGLLMIFLLYVRRRRKNQKPKDHDENPPFISLTPRPAPTSRRERSGSGPGSGPGLGATSKLPIGVVRSKIREREESIVHKTSLSMGSRGGMVDSDSRAVEAEAGFGFHIPRRVLFRSSSAPMEAPTPPSRIPPFRGLNSSNMSISGQSPRGTLSPGKGKDRKVKIESPGLPPILGSGSNLGGGLKSPGREPRPSTDILSLGRQSSMPLYHEALRDQAELEREANERLQAEGLGLPIIAVRRTTSYNEAGDIRGSEGSLVSELLEDDMVRVGGQRVEEGEEEESDSDDERYSERGRKAGLDLRVGMGENGGDSAREADLHSTRASSGVFPEGDGNIEGDIGGRDERDVYS
ncbi:uncharacterized protein RSE6_09340 [Rhynchosporium secalis]|uniref:Uncharacterized protein n=1 Tax=Rhynchosporium secalis TaxID=38038 RepID=A0A1E1MHS6_RHYSE|nr:uncharacterized protein RSE6_09340 [Rhynchosporium secalis]